MSDLVEKLYESLESQITMTAGISKAFDAVDNRIVNNIKGLVCKNIRKGAAGG